jgi:hypothetical protein
MVFGLENIKGLDFLNNINFSGILSGIGRFITIAVLAIIAAALIGIWYYIRAQKKQYSIVLPFFEVINGETKPIKEYLAAEYIIPKTQIRIFHIKENDFYLPRGTKPMGRGVYWYVILDNREIINFTLGDINKEVKKAGFLFDHSDMRFANENLKELINRNYRDKSLKWWKEYKDVISMVILVFVLTVSFVFIASKLGGIVDKINAMLPTLQAIQDQQLQILKALNELKLTSGILQG